MTRLAILIVLTLTAAVSLAADKTLTVAGDGSGDFKTIQEALAAVPDNSPDRTILHIKAGSYQGPMVVTKSKTNVTFQGDGNDKSIITSSKNVFDPISPGGDRFNPCVQV